MKLLKVNGTPNILHQGGQFGFGFGLYFGHLIHFNIHFSIHIYFIYESLGRTHLKDDIAALQSFVRSLVALPQKSYKIGFLYIFRFYLLLSCNKNIAPLKRKGFAFAL